jgi:hypothetical protein
MIDDLVPVAVTRNGKLGPHNDWGYLMDQPNSLFSYFQRFLLSKFPEIKGTFFVPLESQYSISEENGYAVFKKDIDKEFIEFIKRQANEFEIAFHGIRHTYKKDNTRFFEFENPNLEDFTTFKNKIDAYASMGIEFTGGKFPGYRFNETAIEFIQFMNYKWFALNAGMINRKSQGNKLSYINNTNIVNIPTNLAGDIFNIKPKKAGFLKRSIKRILFPGRYIKPEEYLEYLYIHGHPIFIQEHFQNQGTEGKRQTPNIYDDICSLDRIFGLLRPLDIWYACCSEIAHYYDSYKNTEIVEKKICF